jgi:hypothetical protein
MRCDARDRTTSAQGAEEARESAGAGPQGPPCLFGSGTQRRTGSRRPTLRTSRAMPRAALQSPAGPVGRTAQQHRQVHRRERTKAACGTARHGALPHFHTCARQSHTRTHAPRTTPGRQQAQALTLAYYVYIYIIAYIIRRAACISANHPSKPIHQARPIALPLAMPKLLKFLKFLPTGRLRIGSAPARTRRPSRRRRPRRRAVGDEQRPREADVLREELCTCGR